MQDFVRFFFLFSKLRSNAVVFPDFPFSSQFPFSLCFSLCFPCFRSVLHYWGDCCPVLRFPCSFLKKKGKENHQSNTLQPEIIAILIPKTIFRNLLMPLFLMGCFPVDFQEVKRPLRTKSVKRPIKVGKQPINEGKRPIKAKVLVSVSVGCLMGCFRAPPLWRKTAPLKRPIKRSMMFIKSSISTSPGFHS